MSGYPRNAQCFCGSGLKYKKCCGQKNIHPDSFIGRLRRLYHLIDEVVQQHESATSSLPCHKGCSNCCLRTFNIGPLEFVEIQQGVTQLPQETIDKICETARVQYRYLLDNYPDTVRAKHGGEISWGQLRHKLLQTQVHEQLDLPCPFLDQGTCSIYNHRPWICRVWGIFSFPLEPCNHINARHRQYQLPITQDLHIDLALGVTYVGKPITVWLAEWFNQGLPQRQNWDAIAERPAGSPTTGEYLSSSLPSL